MQKNQKIKNQNVILQTIFCKNIFFHNQNTLNSNIRKNPNNCNMTYFFDPSTMQKNQKIKKQKAKYNCKKIR